MTSGCSWRPYTYLFSTVEADYTSAGGTAALDYKKVADLMGAMLQHTHIDGPHKSMPGVVVG